PLVVLITGNFGDSIADTGRAHLEGIRDRQRRLLLERTDSAIPKLRLIIERVQDGWRVALTDKAVDADRRGAAVGESACRMVARGAGDCAVTREPTVEEQLLASATVAGVSGLAGGTTDAVSAEGKPT